MTATEVSVEEMREWLKDGYPECLTADGFDEAIIGVACGCGRPNAVIYDLDKCIEILMKRDGMTSDEAREFLDFNTFGGYVGEHTPVFLHQPS